MRILMFAFILLSGNVFADWSKGYVKDEMRGTQVEVTDTSVSPISGSGPKLYVAVQKLSGADGQYGFQLRLDGNYPRIDCEKYCEIPLRFDESTVVENSFLSSTFAFITPRSPNSLVRAMGLADNMLIEVPATDGRRYQYKINMLGFNIKAPAKPRISIAGLTIGDDISTLPNNFTQLESRPDCFVATDVSIEKADLKSPKVTTCIIKNKIASVSFSAAKHDLKQFNELLTKQFGAIDKGREKISKTISWPNENFEMISNTVSAFSMLGTYYITDSSLEYFGKK